MMKIKETSQLKQHFDQHKILVMKVLLIFTFIGGLVFFLINFPLGFYTLATIELMASLISLILWIYLRRDVSAQLFNRIAYSYVFMLCCIMLIVFSPLYTSITVFSFALLIPLLTHLLMGSRNGMIFTTVFLSITLTFFIYKHHDLPILNRPSDIANIATVVLLIWGLAFSYERSNEKAKDKLIYLASHDFMTGLYNRALLNDIFQSKLNRSYNNKMPLSMLVADLDHFKKINDMYGHYAGDEIIKKFADILQYHSGSEGTCFRVGGEEFCIVFSKTDINCCCRIAEKIRLATQNITLGNNSDFMPVTTSIGVVSCRKKICDMSALLKKADRKLYQAKQQGRNQVVS